MRQKRSRTTQVQRSLTVVCSPLFGHSCSALAAAGECSACLGSPATARRRRARELRYALARLTESARRCCSQRTRAGTCERAHRGGGGGAHRKERCAAPQCCRGFFANWANAAIASSALASTIASVATTNWLAVAWRLSAYHACADLTGSTLKCWGQNTDGQLGDGTTTNRNTPTTVDVGGTLELLSLGWHTCAYLTGGTLKC